MPLEAALGLVRPDEAGVPQIPLVPSPAGFGGGLNVGRLVVILGRVRLTVALWTPNAARLTIALLTTNSALRTVGWLKAILLAVPVFRPGAERVSASWLCCRTMSSRNLRSTSPMARLSVTKNI